MESVLQQLNLFITQFLKTCMHFLINLFYICSLCHYIISYYNIIQKTEVLKSTLHWVLRTIEYTGPLAHD